MATAMILAGGIGKRMGNTSEPKQYLMLGSKPIIIHTIEQFLLNERIDRVFVLVPKDWIGYTGDLVDKYCIKTEKKVIIIAGGEERSETIFIGCREVLKELGYDEKVITHDAVRPFVSQRIIDDNIDGLNTSRVVNTIMSSPDTIVRLSNSEDTIKEIPIRQYMALGQTPQSFYINDYLALYDGMDDQELDTVTDACKMFVDASIPVHYVFGSQDNIKITTMLDFDIAQFLLGRN